MAQNFDGLRQRAVFSFGLQKCICSGVQCFSPVAVVVAFVVPRLFLVLPRFSCSSSLLSFSLLFFWYSSLGSLWVFWVLLSNYFRLQLKMQI